MGVVEWVVGFGTFLVVGLLIFLFLEAVAPGSSTNPFVGAAVGVAAGWFVTKLFGD